RRAHRPRSPGCAWPHDNRRSRPGPSIRRRCRKTNEGVIAASRRAVIIAVSKEHAMARPQRQVEAAPQPAARPMCLSIFGLDRTLTVQPTYSRFLLFAARHRAPWRLLLVPLLVPVALLYAVKLISRRTMKEAMHGIALGRRL